MGSVPFLLRARPQKRPTSERESASTIRNYNWIVLTLFCVSSFSPYNVIVYWHKDDTSFELLWFTLWLCHHILNLVENSQYSNPRKIVHSNSIGSPSIRSKSLRLRVSKNHLILLSQTLTGSSRIPPRHCTQTEETQVWAVANLTALSVNRVVSLHKGCCQSIVVNRVISVWAVINFSVTWSTCFKDFKGWFLVDRNFSV